MIIKNMFHVHVYMPNGFVDGVLVEKRHWNKQKKNKCPLALAFGWNVKSFCIACNKCSIRLDKYKCNTYNVKTGGEVKLNKDEILLRFRRQIWFVWFSAGSEKFIREPIRLCGCSWCVSFSHQTSSFVYLVLVVLSLNRNGPHTRTHSNTRTHTHTFIQMKWCRKESRR